jgi:nucleoside-diphosphate-sugar epimerase
VTSDRVLVTGAAGFIGSHLCRRLVDDGLDVVGLDDLSDGSGANLAAVPEVRLVEADLRDEHAVRDAARGCTAIYHQGAKRSVARSMDEPGLIADVNVRGTLNVLLAAREENAALVSASSSSVYGDQDTFPLSENMTPRPRSPYAASKLAAEAFVGALHRSYGVRAVSLRYFNVYGPGMDPTSEYALVVPLFITACLAGTRPVIQGDGEQSRDFTYIDDVVEANLLSARARHGAQGLAYNIGGGAAPTSVNTLLAMIADQCSATPIPIKEPRRPGDVRMTHADLSLATELLGYVPKVGIDDGIARTVAAFKTRMDQAG